MTIFQIQIPKAVPAKTEPTPSQSVTPDGAPNVANSGEQTAKVDDELQAARKLDGEEKAASTEEDKPKQEREARLISIDGPVGRIYSAALQEVFANEGMAAMMHDLSDAEGGVGIDGEPVGEDLDGDNVVHQSVAGVKHTSVYTYTADTLNLKDVVKISNEISRNKGRDYIIAVEGVTFGNISKATEMLCDMEKAGQLKLCLSRGSAMSAIVSSVKS